MKGPFKERHSQVLRCLCFHPPPLYSGLLRPTTPAETISKSWNSVSLSPCQSSWRRWRCLWWWRSTRRSPWPASTTCPTGSTWSGCRQTLTRQTWRTPQTRKWVFFCCYTLQADVGEIKIESATNKEHITTKLAQYIWFFIPHQNRNLKNLSRPDTWGLDTATPSSRLSSTMVAAFCNQNYVGCKSGQILFLLGEK